MAQKVKEGVRPPGADDPDIFMVRAVAGIVDKSVPWEEALKGNLVVSREASINGM